MPKNKYTRSIATRYKITTKYRNFWKIRVKMPAHILEWKSGESLYEMVYLLQCGKFCCKKSFLVSSVSAFLPQNNHKQVINKNVDS